MNFLKTMMAPFNKGINLFWSFFSEQGKMSMKRGISWLFAMAILYIVWFFLNRVVPIQNQPALLHMFDAICLMIAVLTGAATVKDIITIWRGGNPGSADPKDIAESTEEIKQPNQPQ